MEFLGEISPYAKSIRDRVFKEEKDRHQIYKECINLFCSFSARHDSEPCFAGISALFLSDWWTRVWTFQEITLARQVKVQVGKKSLPWEYFEIFSNISTVNTIQ